MARIQKNSKFFKEMKEFIVNLPQQSVTNASIQRFAVGYTVPEGINAIAFVEKCVDGNNGTSRGMSLYGQFMLGIGDFTVSSGKYLSGRYVSGEAGPEGSPRRSYITTTVPSGCLFLVSGDTLNMAYVNYDPYFNYGLHKPTQWTIKVVEFFKGA